MPTWFFRKITHMHNWCFSSVIITGSPEELKRFADIIGTDFDFNRIVPMPEELRTTVAGCHIEYMVYYGNGVDGKDHEGHRGELDQDPKNRERTDRDRALLDKYGAYDWYDWCVKNWGTKWTAQEVEIETRDGETSIFFETAWSFPEPIFDRLGAMLVMRRNL